MEPSDWQLLEDYARRNSEDAFRRIVDRYGGLVYHAALRQAGRAHVAEEVAQAVFIALARKAGKLSRGVVLSGWLLRATRFAVSNLAREEIRRQRREQEAMAMQTNSGEDSADSAWEHVAPHLADALDALPARDRKAILIRFFEERSHQAVARSLRVSEDAAKMRVSRAIERLRLVFAKKGFLVSSAALLAALSNFGALAAPLGLTQAIVTAAAAQSGAAGTSTSLITAKGILKLMAWSKIKTAVGAGLALLVVGGGIGLIQRRHAVQVKVQVPALAPDAPANTTVDRSTPTKAMLAISRALDTGDAALIAATFKFTSPGDDEVKDVFERLVGAIGQYRKVATARFGDAAVEESLNALPFRLPPEKAEAALVRIEGDRATVHLDPTDQPSIFVRENGQWKTTMEGFFHMSNEDLITRGKVLIRNHERAAAEVAAGRYASAIEAAESIGPR
ncbi:MAG TPA: sigma-70 family RNA polymerase sigma factor [Lacipirellulaceae bacterium]|nr:sigma-70 family RNA polymerase sigma factor [Lacipirellulaceae bacterium]